MPPGAAAGHSAAGAAAAAVPSAAWGGAGAAGRSYADVAAAAAILAGGGVRGGAPGQSIRQGPRGEGVRGREGGGAGSEGRRVTGPQLHSTEVQRSLPPPASPDVGSTPGSSLHAHAPDSSRMEWSATDTSPHSSSHSHHHSSAQQQGSLPSPIAPPTGQPSFPPDAPPHPVLVPAQAAHAQHAQQEQSTGGGKKEGMLRRVLRSGNTAPSPPCAAPSAPCHAGGVGAWPGGADADGAAWGGMHASGVMACGSAPAAPSPVAGEGMRAGGEVEAPRVPRVKETRRRSTFAQGVRSVVRRLFSKGAHVAAQMEAEEAAAPAHPPAVRLLKS
jgi:hypothetical protein